MEKSDYTTPRVFSLMRMMSHPKSLIGQFIHLSSEILLDDGVEILNCHILFINGVQSCVMFFLWIVSNPGHGTRIARGFVRYKGYQHGFMSIRSISKFLNQNCKRCPSSSLCELKCV